jgi:hypothetical protein
MDYTNKSVADCSSYSSEERYGSKTSKQNGICSSYDSIISSLIIVSLGLLIPIFLATNCVSDLKTGSAQTACVSCKQHVSILSMLFKRVLKS